jgi:hypothetical protein
MIIVNIRNVDRKTENAAKNRLRNVMGKKKSIPVIAKKKSRKGAFNFEYLGS